MGHLKDGAKETDWAGEIAEVGRVDVMVGQRM
jgi:hypothetical protein